MQSLRNIRYVALNNFVIVNRYLFQIADYWVDLVLENWIQLISDRNASHFIRTLTYHLTGLRRKRSGETEKFLTKNALSKKVQVSPAAKESFKRIANMALDYASINGKYYY